MRRRAAPRLAHRAQRRRVRPAPFHHVRAARVEDAPGGKLPQVGRRARDAGHGHARTVQGRERAQQAERVRMSRAPVQLAGGSRFHQPARVHHRDGVGDLDQQRQVMGDEQDREAEPVAQRHQLVENLALGDDVQRGRRLVHDQDLRVERHRHGDHDALPHAAGQLVRVAAEPVGRNADHARAARRPWTAGRPGPGPAGAPGARRSAGRRPTSPGSARAWRSAARRPGGSSAARGARRLRRRAGRATNPGPASAEIRSRTVPPVMTPGGRSSRVMA